MVNHNPENSTKERVGTTRLAVSVAAFLLLSFAYAASFSLIESNPPSATSTSGSASFSLPSQAGSVPPILSASGSLPIIISASLGPLKVRPGDSMLVSAQISDPSGVSQVSAGMGGIETVPFISIAHYTGWWKHG